MNGLQIAAGCNCRHGPKTERGDPELFRQQADFCGRQRGWHRRASRSQRKQALYGSDITHKEILDGKAAVPEPVRSLLAELGNFQEMSMANKLNETKAFGWPGIEPRWTHGGKDGVGTAYAASSKVWFTFWNGIITEV